MRFILKLFFVLLLLCVETCCVLAQNPNLAESDLDYSREIVAHYHFVAFVSLELKENEYTRYQYDHYPADSKNPSCERIKCTEGIFAHEGNRKWLKSDDWGKTGPEASDDLAGKLDFYVSGANAMLRKPVHHNLSQGATVWKYLKTNEDQKAKITEYTYEESREHPMPDGVYPQYTFVKFQGDKDGRLFIAKTTGQMKTDDGHAIPFEIQFTYLVPLPPGAVVKYSHAGHVVETGVVQPDGSEKDTPAVRTEK